MNVSKNLIIILFTIFVFSSSYAQKQKADLIIVDAKVHTMDKKRPKAQAIAIKGNKIIAVEKRFGKIEKYRGKNTRQINARGRVVIPGFNDSHTHFMGIGNLFSSFELKNIRNRREITERMRLFVRFIPKGRWILGSGWNTQNWTSKNLPTKDLIDSITPDNPVFLYNSDATMAFANSVALEMAGVNKNKSEIEGGEIVRDKNGEPTGVLKGKAMLFVSTIAPKANTKRLLEVAETGTNYAAYLGVTSVQDMHSDYISDLMQELNRQGKLKTRIYDCTPLAEWKKLADKGIKRATGDAMIRTGCLKSFTDGFPEEREQIYGYIDNADKNDLQVMMHAIGVRPNSMMFSIYEQILRENGAKDRRFRIEHAHRFLPDDIKRFANSDIIASIQPHLFQGNDPYRSLMKTKAKIAFGSDASITDFNPLLGIHAAVNAGREKISVKDAVYFYTMGSAYGEFQEDVKGSITVGKLADIVILSDDIFEIEPSKIRDVKVEMTIMDGKIVYNQRNSQ